MTVRTLLLSTLAFVVAACGPRDELQRGVECAEQPGPRSAQECYARDEPRFIAVVKSLDERELAAGADSAVVRRSRSALEATVAACGAAPDTSVRATTDARAGWECRHQAYRTHLRARAPK